LPELSVARHDTCVRPRGNFDPEAGAHRIETAGSLSIAETAKLTGPPLRLVATAVRLSGRTSRGATASGICARKAWESWPAVADDVPAT
jgi:hypothetical protein